jgi:CheY-like chemotaxis protein
MSWTFVQDHASLLVHGAEKASEGTMSVGVGLGQATAWPSALREPGPRYRRTAPKSRVLLVEDHSLVRSTTARVLGREFAVTAVGSGEEALLRFKRGAFDVVVTDYRMAVMTGIELLEQIRVLDPNVRRVLLSGAHIPGLQGFIGAGIVERCLWKPVDLRVELRALLGEHVSRRD